MDLKERSPESATHDLIDSDAVSLSVGAPAPFSLSVGAPAPTGRGRRAFVGGAAAAVAAAATFLRSGVALAKSDPNLAAVLPPGFTPFSAPGRVVRVKKAGCMEANGLFPKADDAKEMLRRGLEELTGKADLVEAAKLFVSPQDKVCVKVNGIALQNMSTNKELVLPFLDAMIASGVPAANITVLEQYPGFLAGTRINAKDRK